jgi:drug/metabolite transporter (DMT)-like permease
VLSIGTVGLMFWLIRRSASTGFASLFYLVPAVTALMAYILFGEKLDPISIAGMVVCAAGVVLVNRGARVQPASPNAAASAIAEK